MKNVTVTLDEEVARWARVRAARDNVSLSRYLGGLLEEQMQHERAYETSMTRYLSRGPEPLKGEGETYPRREALHELDLLR